MNFIAETNKYARLIEAWKNGHGFSDREALQDIANLWDEFKALPERRSVIYPGSNTIAPKTDLSCASCVFDLLTYVYNWRRALVHEVPQDIPDVRQATIETVDFKGVDSPEVKELKQEIIESLKSYDKPQTLPKVQLGVNDDLTKIWGDGSGIEDGKIDFYGSMKMHELRRLAKDHKIQYSNKTKASELVELIKQKVGEKG